MMKAVKYLSVAVVLAATLVVSFKTAEAAFRRSYYYGWRSYPARSYYYNYYYYKPTPAYTGYKYHTCVYYPSRPQYVYYYNPYQKQYWGRYDLEAKGYSLLADADRKGTLKEIPESAFPAPGEMPAIPDSEDGETIPEPPAVPEGDVPAGDGGTPQ
jgi:hypothetical protein